MKDKKVNENQYALYKTNDESYTLFNINREEHYHSYAGAYQEARIKYFDACRIAELSDNNECVHIFEVGFGLGYNLLPILDFLKSSAIKIYYESTENDLNLFPFLLKNLKELYPPESCKLMNELLENKSYKSSQLEVKILLGDARKSIRAINSYIFDAIYHDPFSPYKNTECWTVQFFKEEKRIMKEHAILSTYSMSTPVRTGMHQAGLNVWDGVGDETKSTGTIATRIKLPKLIELSKKMKQKFSKSPDRFVFSDNTTMDLNHILIKKNRLIEKNNFLNSS